MEDYIRALPKAELHLHLEGAIEPPTLARLARHHGMPEPAANLYSYSDFTGFLQAFKTVCLHLKDAQDYHLVTLRMIERLKRDGVVYAEVYLAAGVMQWKGDDFAHLFEGIDAGAQEGLARYGVRVQWILDAVWQFGPEAARKVAETAVVFRDRGVIGIGLGGDERRGPPAAFAPVYDYARAHGLCLTAHAGETSGPETVWGALRELGAQRIGHGTQAINDPQLVAHLAKSRIPVDVCLSSNLATGAIPSLAAHPLRRYFDAGVLVSLSTDDPAMFHADLTGEYLLAHQQFGFTREELAQLAANSFQASFLSAGEKTKLAAGVAT